MANITTITLTHNEEDNIERCLKALAWADERIIIDSFSKDKTLEKARPLCTKIIQQKMRDFSSLRNKGIQEAKGEWVLMVDADEIIPAELANEIRLAVDDKRFNGYYLNRINYMYGIKLSHDQPDYHLRLFRKSEAFYQNAVHEIAHIKGDTETLKSSFNHYSMKNITEHVGKMNLYTDISSSHTARASIGLFIKPFYRFFDILLRKKAYREGLIGVILSLHAFFYEFINLFKVWEKKFLTKGWDNFYKDTDSNAESAYQSMVHEEFISSIKATSARSLLEVGSGAASITISMAKNTDFKITTIDNNIKILNKVELDVKRAGVDVKVACADGFNLPFKDNSFDLVYSQGVLEHFCDKDILRLIKEALRVCRDSLIFSVPNNHYNCRDFGDERLLSKKYWENLLKDFNVIESKNYYYKRTKRNFLRMLPLMYMCRIKKTI